MITDAMVTAAWRAAPATVRERLDPDEVRRMVAAAMAEATEEARRVINAALEPAYRIAPIPQRPDAEGDW